MSFALVFHVAPRTGEVPLDPLGAGGLPIRHDQAGVDPLGGHGNLEDHAARTRPGPGLVPRRVEARDRAPSALRGSFGLCDPLPSPPLPHGMAGQSGPITEVGLGCAPLQHLGRGHVAGTAHQHQGVGPGVAQPLAQAVAHRQPLGTGATLGLAKGGAKAPGEALIEGQRQKAIAARLGGVPGLCLLPRGPGLGVIDLEHENLGGGR